MNLPTSYSVPQKSVGKKLLIIGLLLLIVASFVFGDPKGWLNGAITAVENLGPWGPVVFALVYIVATVLMVPGSALTLSAGALFGVVYGTGIVSIASTSAAAIAFLIGRFLARDAIAARTAGNASFAALDRALGKDGWKIVALTRLTPIFPFALLNYAFGLTRVKFLHYVIASWIAMLPATVLYVYLGSLARAGLKSGEKTPLEWAMYGVGLLATIAVTIIVTRMAKKAIKDAGIEATASPPSTRQKDETERE